ERVVAGTVTEKPLKQKKIGIYSRLADQLFIFAILSLVMNRHMGQTSLFFLHLGAKDALLRKIMEWKKCLSYDIEVAVTALPPDFTSPGGAHVEPHIMLVVFLLSMNLIYFLILEGFMTEVENSWYRKRKNFIGKLKKHAVWNFYNNLLGGRSIHDNFMMNLAEFWNMWDLVYSGCGQGADIVGATHKKKGFNSIVILVAWQIWKHRNALYYGFFFFGFSKCLQIFYSSFLIVHPEGIFIGVTKFRLNYNNGQKPCTNETVNTIAVDHINNTACLPF
ncbi:hypothetical protein ACJX0J_017904, partial [Zea mays]